MNMLNDANRIEKKQELGILFKHFAKNYLNNPDQQLLDKVCNILIDEVSIDTKRYKVYSSTGNGNTAHVPWVAVLNKNLTLSAKYGIYIVYLFAIDMSKMYISLNQGIDFIKSNFGPNKVKYLTNYLRNTIEDIPQGFSFDPIDLKPNLVRNGQLAKDYASGHILGKEYDLNSLPNDEILLKDLRDLILVYEKNILKLFEIKDENEINPDKSVLKENLRNFYGYFISSPKTSEESNNNVNLLLSNISGKKNHRPEPKKLNRERSISQYPRDDTVKARAIELAGFKCEIDSSHTSFTRRTNGLQYTEGHHLIPLEHQDKYNSSLDVVENICSLCCNCHKCIHYGTDNEREPILKQLYESKKSKLIEKGLKVDVETLKQYYKFDY